MAKIVWLASYPKSGNTWLRAFLHNYITQATAPHSINALTDFSVSECNAAFFAKYDPRPAAEYSTQDVQRLRPLVHQDLTSLHDDLVFVKTHNAALALHDVPLCTPAVTAGAVYLVRDPRDVAISYAQYTGQSIDQVIAFMAKTGAANRGTGAQVFEFLSSWSRHVGSWTQSRFHHVARYEDMLEKPAGTFGGIIRFLGDDPDPARLARAISFSNFETLSGQEGEHGYAANAPGASAKFFRAGKSGQWQNILTAPQIKRIETDHAAVMRRFFYL
jgi:hypothetical protein